MFFHPFNFCNISAYLLHFFYALNTLLSATICLDFAYLHLITHPNDPDPIVYINSNLGIKLLII